ncbi:hypothetical protein WR25_12855 [Diploscapter pachys]|uniref:Protein kinase domain-containing protein n=1 Tax=Diploscapter pachys TaxID=2018661 RepID=A0A2A2JBC7_9BILA|nr:hypothetical protein WR25_12855 [Diploscapter pachys]
MRSKTPYFTVFLSILLTPTEAVPQIGLPAMTMNPYSMYGLNYPMMSSIYNPMMGFGSMGMNPYFGSGIYSNPGMLGNMYDSYGLRGPVYDGMPDNSMGMGSMGTNNYDYMNPYSGGTSSSSGTSSINNGESGILGYSSPRMSSSGGCSTCGMNGMNSMGDELKKKISEGYSVVRSRLNDDVRFRSATWMPLQIAAFEKSPQEFTDLLTAENVESRTLQQLTLLHVICAGHSESQVQKLQAVFAACENDDAKKRSLLSQLTNNGFTALHLAIYKGDLPVVECLLKEGADPSLAGGHLLPPLHLAAMTGSHQIVNVLLDKGASLLANDFVKFTALHCATYFAHEQVVKVLLNRGADANWEGGVRDRPLHLAAGRGLTTITVQLLEAGADLTLADDEGNVALHYAAKAGHLAAIQLLLKRAKGAQEMVSTRNVYGDTSLHLACYAGRLDIAKLLLSYSNTSIVNQENAFSETPLHAACTGGRSVELVAFLMKQPGVDANYQGADGHTALHSACYHGHVRIVQYLLDNGADQSLAAKASDTPLAYQSNGTLMRPSKVAAAMIALNRADTPSSMSSHNSTISLEDQQTPVLWAYEKGHDRIVMLLKHYANKRMEGDLCSEYSSGESSYTPLPSPMGRLTSLTRDKAEILQLRSSLSGPFHLSLADVDFQEAIGSGSFGKVYKGTYRGRTVAIKRYRAMAFGCKSETDMLCREVSILSRLSHPNIISFVGAALDDPSQFAIITEFVENGSLFSILHEQKRIITPDFRLRISFDVAQGMRYLHESAIKTVIHRDLNSHNILIHVDGRAVVSDFGESRFTNNHEEDNMTKQPGNLRWMSPEVFSQCGRYDHKVDMFSFALVVWEIHSAELPFSHLKPAAAAAEMTYKKGRPPLPNSPTSQFPEHILGLLPRAWNAEPDMRPNFSEIIPILEPHVVSHTEMDVQSTVSQLKNQWEQMSVAPPPSRSVFPSTITTLHNITPIGTVEELRQRIDKHGYVTIKDPIVPTSTQQQQQQLPSPGSHSPKKEVSKDKEPAKEPVAPVSTQASPKKEVVKDPVTSNSSQPAQMSKKDQKEVAKDPIVPTSAQNTLKKESKETAKEPIVPTSNQASLKKDSKDTTKEKENKDAQSTTKSS